MLAAAIVATAASRGLVFRVISAAPRGQSRARQIGGTAEDILDLAEDVDPERDHIRGPEDAPVTLVEYGDYECPYCGQAEPVDPRAARLVRRRPALRLAPLPLNDVHPHAQLAAEAAEAAAAQGAFWEMHDALLAHQDELAPRDLGRYAEELGLDVERFWERAAPPRRTPARSPRTSRAPTRAACPARPVLHQRPPPPRRLRRRHAHGRVRAARDDAASTRHR